MRFAHDSIRKRISIRASFCGALLVFVLALRVSSVSAEDKWLALGDGKASGDSTSTYIPSNGTRQTVCSIRFEVQGSTIELDEITVHFTNHQNMHVSVQYKLADQAYSQAIALPGNRRSVAGVDLVYARLAPGTLPPTIHLWGNALPGQTYCPR